MKNINNIFVLGGTHGNEYTGAFLVNNWETVFPNDFLQSKIDIIPMLSNPRAFSNGTRYIDKDLNRVFSLRELDDPSMLCYEHKRARAINQVIGPKVNNTNFIIDLHTTNAAMGITLMTSSNDINKMNLIKFICDHMDNVNVIYTEDGNSDRPFLNSITKHSLLVEIGGVANNIIDHKIFESTKNVVRLTIDYLNKLKGDIVSIDENLSIPAYEIIQKVGYPRDGDGLIKGMVHKDIQGKDFVKEIDASTKIFSLFDGTDICLDKDGQYYMSFINESAYYEEDTAFYLMRKTQINPNKTH